MISIMFRNLSVLPIQILSLSLSLFLFHCSSKEEQQDSEILLPAFDIQKLPSGNVVLVNPPQILLYQADGTLLKTIAANSDDVAWAQVLPGKKYVLSQNRSGQVQLHALEGMLSSVIVQTQNTDTPITAVVPLNPQELWILYGDRIHVFQTQDGSFLKEIPLGGFVSSNFKLVFGKFDPKGRYLVASTANHRLYVWDPLTGEWIQDLGINSKQVAISEGPMDSDIGVWLAGRLSDGGATLWQWASATKTFDSVVPPHYSWPNEDLNKILLDIIGGGRVWFPSIIPGFGVRVRNLVTGMTDFSIPIAEEIDFVRADGDWIFVKTGNKAQAFLLSRKIDSLTGHQGPVTGVAFSPNGKQVLTGSSDHLVKIWNFDGMAWQEDKGKIKVHDSEISSVAFSPSGLWIAVGHKNQELEVFGQQAMSGTIQTLTNSTFLKKVTFSSTGKWLMGVDTLGDIDLFSISGGIWKFQQRLEGTNWRGGIATMSLDEQMVLIVNQNNIVVWTWDGSVWNRQMSVLSANPKDHIIGTSSSDLMHMFAINSDHTVTTWSLSGTTWSFISKQPQSVPTWISDSDVAFLFPNRPFFLTPANEFAGVIWSLTEGQAAEEQVLLGHKGAILDADVSSDEEWIVTGSADQTARIWNLHPQVVNSFIWN